MDSTLIILLTTAIAFWSLERIAGLQCYHDTGLRKDYPPLPGVLDRLGEGEEKSLQESPVVKILGAASKLVPNPIYSGAIQGVAEIADGFMSIIGQKPEPKPCQSCIKLKVAEKGYGFMCGTGGGCPKVDTEEENCSEEDGTTTCCCETDKCNGGFGLVPKIKHLILALGILILYAQFL
ncbi:MAG: hypothetical protein GY696_05580 [Gammaproteobacteria bacterium]|nr:hypothetical protein [Gammaproteobacteria bacterium]